MMQSTQRKSHDAHLQRHRRGSPGERNACMQSQERSKVCQQQAQPCPKQEAVNQEHILFSCTDPAEIVNDVRPAIMVYAWRSESQRITTNQTTILRCPQSCKTLGLLRSHELQETRRAADKDVVSFIDHLHNNRNRIPQPTEAHG